MSDELLYEVREGTAFLTINREAKRNSLSREVMAAFLVCLEQAEKDDNVRSVCISGAGGLFCSGADLGGAFGVDEEGRLPGAGEFADLLKRLAGFGKPTLARVNGPCLAGGLGVMLACDIVLAADDAWFSAPEVNVGLFPMMVGALLYRNVGRKKALDMVLTGRRVSAAEAEAMGLVTEALPSSGLDGQVEKTLKLLGEKSPTALSMGKKAFHAMADMPFEDAMDFLCGELGKVVATGDAAEGMAAFREKRKPHFRGR